MNTLKDAMKSGDKRTVSTIRMVQAALKDKDIEARGLGKGPLSDEDIISLLQKLVKQRAESLKIYEDAGREDLASTEREEIAIISNFLPKQMSDEEAAAAVKALVDELGIAGMKDLGRLMGAAKERFAGRLDMGRVNALAKAALS
jgi:uncharacterized protein